MKLIWHCHACFELISADGSVVFDPYSPGSVRGLELSPLRADRVICSHGHSDHNYTDGVELSGIEPGFSLTQVPTYHDGKLGALRGDNLCSVVEAEGMRIAHLGDLGHTLDPETAAKLKPLDVLMRLLHDLSAAGKGDRYRAGCKNDHPHALSRCRHRT
mgnify:CR=1 FL=1